MRKLLLASAALMAAASVTAPANATVFIDFLDGTPVSDLSDYTVINTFDSTSGITGSNFQLQSNSNSSGAVIPLSDSSGTSYLTVKGGGTASLNLPNASAFAMEWGSLDTYNTLTISMLGGDSITLVPGQTYLNGSPADGDRLDPKTNGTLVVWGDAGEVFTGLTMASRGNSFEVDNLAIKSVPEASTWAMMIAGLGAVGLSMRRKRNVAVSFA